MLSICELCNQETENFFTIPLDANWQRTSGLFCSVKCALWANEFVNTSMRGVENSQIRREWMQQKYREANGKLVDKRKI